MGLLLFKIRLYASGTKIPIGLLQSSKNYSDGMKRIERVEKNSIKRKTNRKHICNKQCFLINHEIKTDRK